jgi:hypothetical protein
MRIPDYMFTDAENSGTDCRNFAANIRSASRIDGTDTEKLEAMKAACARAKTVARDFEFRVDWIERELSSTQPDPPSLMRRKR